MRIKHFAVFLSLLVVSVFAQTDRGTITGTVTDPAGAVVANADLELKGTDTGTTYPAVTSPTGNYTLTQIPVGNYELSVSVTGFKKLVRQNIRVQGAQTVGLDLQLEVGNTTESVTVSSQVSLLKTESSDVATNIDSSMLNTLPILPIGFGYSSAHGVRNPMAVTSLSPGTFYDNGSNVKVNGAPSNTEAVHVDGQDATSGIVPFFQPTNQPSVEALQELSIQTSNFAAEYGQAGAGMFNYTTKSGTNRYSGSLYDNIANDAFNSSQAYTHNKPRTRLNNFGISLGGPLSIPKLYDGKDRTFFFFNYEGFREVGTIANLFPTVPTDAYRNGDFSSAMGRGTITGSPADSTGRIALDGQIFDPLSEVRDANGRRVRQPFAGNLIPQSRFDPVAVNLLKLIPRANRGTALVQNYFSPFPTDRYTRIPSVKADHAFSSTSKISFYWSTAGTAVQFCTPLCGSDGFPAPITATRGTFIESYTYRVNYDHTLSPTTLLHVGLGFIHGDFQDTAPTIDFDVAGVLGLRGTPLRPADKARFPAFRNMAGANSTGGLSNIGPGGQVTALEDKPTVNLSLTSVRGNHTYKFGGELRLEGFIDQTFTRTSGEFQLNAAQSGNPYFSDAGVNITGGATGFPMASLLLGRVDQTFINPFTSLRGGRTYTSYFAQDTWKATRKLTLDYGLRWDYSSYSREQYGRAPGFSPTVSNPFAGGRPGYAIFEGDGPGRCNCSFAKNYKKGFGPRVGVAYNMTPKTVIRAGFGITYSPSTGGRYSGAPGAQQTLNAPGFGDPAMVLGDGVNIQGRPLDYSFPNFTPAFPLLGQTVTPPAFQVYDQNLGRPARQFQWSFGIQRELLRNTVVEAAYVGNRGNWWNTSSLTNYNLLTPAILAAHGLNIERAADRTILSSQVGAAGAGRFRGVVPYASFPTNSSVAQSLRPFPQFGDLTGAGPLGKTWYDSLQVKATQRFSHGLTANFNLTWSKELQLGTENNAGGGLINDITNRDINKQFSSFSRPIWAVLTLSYTTPNVTDNRIIRAVLSGWTTGAVLQYGSGQPIPIPLTAVGTSNLGAALLRGTRAQRVAGEPLFLQDLNCHCFDPAQTVVLNSKAWTDPTPGTFTPTAAYQNDYRYQRRPKETMSFGRLFRLNRLREGVTFQARMELNNVFNRTQIPNPVVAGYTALPARANGVYNTGFGVIATLPGSAVIGERSGNLVLRLQF